MKLSHSFLNIDMTFLLWQSLHPLIVGNISTHIFGWAEKNLQKFILIGLSDGKVVEDFLIGMAIEESINQVVVVRLSKLNGRLFDVEHYFLIISVVS